MGIWVRLHVLPLGQVDTQPLESLDTPSPIGAKPAEVTPEKASSPFNFNLRFRTFQQVLFINCSRLSIYGTI